MGKVTEDNQAAVTGLYDAFFGCETFMGAIGIKNLFLPLAPPGGEKKTAAYHVLLTSPYFERYPDQPFEMTAFEQLTAELSALAWRCYNGPIYLITDPAGADYFRQTGLESAYTDILVWLDPCNYGIPPARFWAAGKLQAMARLEAPALLLDLDLIVWKPLQLRNCPLAAAHTEHLADEIYPPRDFFDMSPAYSFPPEWDWFVEPLNTAIMYIGDRELKERYVREAIRFMQFERMSPDTGTKCMVFAEQRLLAMCAAALGIRARVFLDCDCLMDDRGLVTHLWGAKGLLRLCPEIAEKYEALCREKIRELSARMRG